MNEKINLQDLAAQIAEKSAIDVKDAERFLKKLAETIQETLLKEESVRIKDFGTFKRLAVSQRESVDVATGNRMTIPAHYKINFVPDNSLAQAINEPFALFDSVELEDITTPNKAHYSPPNIYHHPRRRRRRRRRWIANLFFVLLVILLGLGAFSYIFLLDKRDFWSNVSKETYPPAIVQDKKVVEDSIVKIAEDSIAEESPRAQPATVEKAVPTKTPAKESEQPVKESTKTQPVAVEKTVSTKTHTIGKDEWLAQVARREYGNRVFWVYLYEENKAIIKDPNVVPAGTVIKIPPAEKYGIDKNNPASVQKAALLQEEYNNKFM